jgi:uncharacterized protein
MRLALVHSPVHAAVEDITIDEARMLFLSGHGLADAPASGAAPSAARVLAMIRALGFVQIDSINVVERAHHHILWTRLPGYRAGERGALHRLQRGGRVFEHWTHDASIIPSEHFPHWRDRFRRMDKIAWKSWLAQRLGSDAESVLAHVMNRVRSDGPVMARDFESGQKRGAWWDWSPTKAALEFWWRAGKLAIPRRENFHKVYDLTERVLPHALNAPEVSRDEHVAWVCSSALARLGVASARELAAFWRAPGVTVTDVGAWIKQSLANGECVAARVVGEGVKPMPGVALVNWRRKAAKARAQIEATKARLRLLSPFDPVVRDRARAQRLFGFDYRFEAFVPASKRKFGYYVLPILQGDRIVGRLDPKADRDAGVLRVRKVWWEREVKPDKARRAALDEALHVYAAFNGVERVEISR